MNTETTEQAQSVEESREPRWNGQQFVFTNDAGNDVIVPTGRAIERIKAAERARVESEQAERVRELEQERDGWNEHIKILRGNLLATFSRVIATPEEGYEADPFLLLSDAMRVTSELVECRAELATLRARLLLLVQKSLTEGIHSERYCETPKAASAIITEWEAQAAPEGETA